MMIRILFSALFLIYGLQGTGAAEKPFAAVEVATPLQKLLSLFAIPEDRIVEETQRQWLQKGKERWEFDHRFEEMRPLVWPLFEEMGLLREAPPSLAHYDYALVHGALLSRVQERIRYLEILLERGLKIDSIVFLSGARPLQKEEKEATGVLMEHEMVRWVYEKSHLPREIPVFFVDAPAKEVDGALIRPQTADTVASWLQTNPKIGTCLAISNQPYVAYQQAVLRKMLPDPFFLETAGPAPQGPPPFVALILDTLAKELYWTCGAN